MFPLGVVQFYISHTCNLACPGCLSFNNYNISGHDLFEDYKNDAIAWSKILDPIDMSIIGGEPMSNPDLHNWAIGLRSIFPYCKDFKICTNGLLIDKWKHNLVEWWNAGIIVEVNAHTPEHFAKAERDIESAIGNKNITKVTSAELTNVPKYYKTDYTIFYVQDNRVVAMIAEEFDFYQWGSKDHNNNQINFYKNNSEDAHNACDINDCHYIYKGKLYKCGTLVGAQALVKKYAIEPSAEKLIQKYKPLEHTDKNILHKVSRLTSDAIKQCSLCPIEPKYTTITNNDVKKVSAPTKYSDS